MPFPPEKPGRRDRRETQPAAIAVGTVSVSTSSSSTSAVASEETSEAIAASTENTDTQTTDVLSAIGSEDDSLQTNPEGAGSLISLLKGLLLQQAEIIELLKPAQR